MVEFSQRPIPMTQQDFNNEEDNKYFTSQAADNESLDRLKKLEVLSMPYYRQKINNSAHVSVSKKMRFISGEVLLYCVHLEDSNGKTVYYPYHPDVRIPSAGNRINRRENLLTDEKLLEYSINSIKASLKSSIYSSN